MRWWTRLMRRRQLERELDLELRFHVDEEAARLAAQGAAPAEARRRALAAFGGLEPMKERTRDARGLRALDDLVKDAAFAVRMMRRQKGFTLAAVTSLALGIGANAAIFSVADALLLRPLPVERPAELSFIERVLPDERNLRFSFPGLERFRAGVPDADFAAMASTGRMQVSIDRGAELVLGQLVSGNWFHVLGVKPAAGRVLEPDDAAGADGRPVTVLSHGYWQRRFGADPAIVGSTMRVNGVPLTIAGIAAPSFIGLNVGSRVDFWMPLTLQHTIRFAGNAAIDDADSSKPWPPQDGITWLTIVMRAAPERADRALARVADVHRQDLERRASALDNVKQRELTLRERVGLLPGERGLSSLREDFTAPLYVLMATVAIVLLIGCANLASLLLARGAARGREFALRLALGAGRGRVVRQLLTESIALALLGGVAGLAVARWGAPALLSLASSSGTPIPLAVPLDARLLAFTFGISLITGAAFGLIPAWRLAGASVAAGVQSGGRTTAAAERLGPLPFGRVLVVAQVALSVTLLIGALLFLRTFQNLVNTDIGFERTEIYAARFDPRLAGFSAEELPALYDRLTAQAQRVPGARTVSIAMAGAVTGWQRISTIVIDGQAERLGRDAAVREDYVDEMYFSTLGLPLIRGRAFSTRDDARAPKVAVVNEAMARQFFGDVDPIGKRFGYGTPADVEIVGLLRDARIDGLREPAPAMVFYPLRQSQEFAGNLYVRVAAASGDVRAAVRRAIAEAAPNLAVREVATIGELANRTVSRERLLSQLTAAFGILAVVVACLGLYGTLSYSVVRRTRELGVRLALGALPSRLRALVLGETMLLVFAGAILGAGAAAAVGSQVATLLYGLSPRDPATFASAIAAVLVVGAVAGVIPAWRASRVDPVVALRSE